MGGWFWIEGGLIPLYGLCTLIDPTISQINETALANILLYDDSNKITSENILYDDSNKITSENSNILQSTIKYVIARIQSDLMNHSSKGHTYMHALLYYIYIDR